MKTTKLLVGAASAALLAGSASAYDLVAANTGLTGTALPDVEGAVTLASELDFSGAAHQGDFEFYVEQDTDNVFTTDDVIVRIDLSNGEFAATVTPANVDANCATSASVSDGGSAGDTFVEFLVSGLDGCDGPGDGGDPNNANIDSAGSFFSGDDLGFSLPVTLDGAGDFGIQTTITTDSGGTNVDGGDATIDFVALEDAFDVDINAANNDSVANLNADPIYSTFDSGGTLGTVELVCDTSVDVDLDGNGVDCNNTNQVVDLTVTLSGDVSAFDGGVQIGGVVATNNVADDESSADITALITGAGGTGSRDVDLDDNAENDAINPSDYTISVSVDLGAAFVDEPAFTGTLASVVREGTTVVVPWFASSAVAASNGSNNVLRLSNLSGSDARVFVEVLTASDGTFVDPGIVETGSAVPANGEMVMTSGTITTLLADDPGRADLRITVEALENNLTFRRFVTAPDGSLTEMTVGTIDQDLDG